MWQLRDAFKKKKFIWKEKFLSGGGGGKKKGLNFPTKFTIKVGKFYQGRGVHYKISFANFKEIVQHFACFRNKFTYFLISKGKIALFWQNHPQNLQFEVLISHTKQAKNSLLFKGGRGSKIIKNFPSILFPSFLGGGGGKRGKALFLPYELFFFWRHP